MAEIKKNGISPLDESTNQSNNVEKGTEDKPCETSPSNPKNSDLTTPIRLIGILENTTEYTRCLLQHLKGYTGTIRVTCTTRTPEQQARVMLNNIKAHGLQSQLNLYASSGDKVCLVYDPKKSDSQNLEAMIAKIYELGPTTVSHHCANPSILNVLDISRTDLSNVNDFLNALTQANIYHIDEPKNNCVHIEIKQK